MALVAETIALHFLVARWSEVAAWVLTGVSVYGAVWLVGDYRACVARRIEVTEESLRLRLGLRWEAEIPYSAIAEIVPLGPGVSDPEELSG